MSSRRRAETARISFLVRSLDHGGAQRQLVTLARCLRDRGHEVSVVVFYGGKPLERELRQARVRVIDLRKRGRWDILGFLARLASTLRREKPDVLHSYLVGSNVLAMLLKPLLRGTRVVWSVRASDRDPSSYDRLTRLSFLVEGRLARAAELVISNSRAGRDRAVERGFPEDRTVVIPNGIDADRFRPDRQAGRRLREEWGVGSGERLVGLVARLQAVKDHPTFLRAAALVEHPETRFVCVGGGREGYRRELRALGESLGLSERIVWAGERGDMPAVYNALDLLVLSSSSGEGFPNVLGEAMASGVPCVATDVGDSARVVGDTGVVVSLRDPAALARAVGIMLDGGPDAGVVRERVVREFGVEALVARTEEALLGRVHTASALA